MNGNLAWFAALTIARHPHRETLLEAALLAAVAVDTHDGAGLVLKALLVLDVLLDAASEETLQKENNKSQTTAVKTSNVVYVCVLGV